MNIFKRLSEYFAFTKNEQKVFLFLSLVMLAGVAVKAYKAYIVPPAAISFDYSVSDSVFNERSKSLINDGLVSDNGRTITKKININGATKTELMSLPGIGEAMAERIMLHRDEKGKFKTINELRKIKGIGEKKFEKLKPHIEVQ
ncbi:MAG: helix-hairpin-helix domain-containing protein [Bacteroidota bacterium]|nr:helix-hairpin-helix domain-containing protein [Bacteroidota bacterium]